MKKKLFLALSLFAGMANAQPVIQSSNYYPIGTTLQFQIANITGVQPGAGGAGQNWNFSNLTLTGDQQVYKHLPVSASPFAATYSASNRAVMMTASNSADTSYLHQTVSNTGAFYDGTAGHYSGSDVVFFYTNPQTIFQYPVSYNWTNTDYFNSNMVTSGGGITMTTYRYGPQQTVADGYGTLQLPGATFTNCLRLKYRQVITDSVVMTGFPLPPDIRTNIKTMYTWIQIVNGVAVERMTMTYDTLFDGSSTNTFTFCQFNNSTTTGLSPVTAGRNLKVYPNPASTHIFLPEDVAGSPDNRIDIIDLHGKTVMSLTEEDKENQSTGGIPVHQLAPGTYLLRLSGSGESGYAKFQKQ